KPLAFIDLETTGVDVQSDRIVEIGIVKHYGDDMEDTFSCYLNPTIPIPIEATRIHHIADRHIAGCLTFAQRAKEIRSFLEGCDFVGFNLLGFDLPLLEVEFSRTSVEFSRRGRSLIDTMKIFHHYNKRDLQSAYFLYTGQKLNTPHEAFGDALANVGILEKQMQKHQDLPQDMEGLGKWCYDADAFVDIEARFIRIGDAICLNFGKFKGWALSEVAFQHPQYLKWMLNQDFAVDTKSVIQQFLS
ncbi:MAG: 3'-5' exonuclease, partial [Candidatus Bathyarchaeota archaeon]